MPDTKIISAYIRNIYPQLFSNEKLIAEFILEQPDSFLSLPTAKLAEKMGVSGSSIVRFCQKMGFEGISDFRLALARQHEASAAMAFGGIMPDDTPELVAQKIFSSNIKTLSDTIAMLDTRALHKAVEHLQTARRIELYGLGSSSTLAMDAYLRLIRAGYPAYGVTDPYMMRLSASSLAEDCCVIGISHTGRTRDVIDTMRIAHEAGAFVIGITSNVKTPVTQTCDVVLSIYSDEAYIMTEAVSSRIAHIALLDTLCACLTLQRQDNEEQIRRSNALMDELRF